MPCNLYGINDNFDPETSHVLPALIRKFHEAKIKNADSVTVWGSGSPLREFLFSDDLADACFYLMQNHSGDDFYNVGFGSDITISELAQTIKEIVGFKGEIKYDISKPDGTPRKLMDISRIKDAGWAPKHTLRDGITLTYQWYLQEKGKSKK